jgi:restriction system protein
LLANRVHWAITYMVQAGLLERPRRAVVACTARGRYVLRKHPERIDNTVLNQFPEFRAFKERSKSPRRQHKSEDNGAVAGSAETEVDSATPEERMELAADEVNVALRQELLSRIVAAPPIFFEHVIVDLMLAMGYGGAGAGKHLGRTADGGVDGVINEDPLGLDIVFLQAKRYAPGNAIGVSQIREFAGTLDERGAVKGVFVTTSSFANPARHYADRSPKRLILIDGDELSRLLIHYGVGVRNFRRFDLNKIDEDYFPSHEP